MKLSGQLLKIERRNGDFQDKVTGTSVPYDFTVLHILDGVDVHVVRLPKGQDSRNVTFEAGELVAVEVTVPKGTKLMISEDSPAFV